MAEGLKVKPQEFYRTFITFLGFKKICKQNTADFKLRINDNVSRDMQGIVEIMGDYFMNITDGLDKTDMSQIFSVTGFEDHCSVEAIADAFSSKFNSFTFSKMQVTEVEGALKDLKPKKSTGWDFIPPKARKCDATQLALHLTTFFNSCIRECQWLSDWKKGEWVPVCKKGDPWIRRITGQLRFK